MFGCCDTRKQTFTFENGTQVAAADRFRAVEILHSASLKNLAEVEQVGVGKWLVTFRKNVFTQVEAPDLAKARKTAEWNLYLDRRTRRLVAMA
jgi:hypothetical protein